MKKFLAIILVMVMVLSCVSVFAETEEIGVFVNGDKLTFDVEPCIENSRTLVPMRAIFEALECDVDYNEDGGTQNIIATKGDTKITLVIGEPKMMVNDEAVELDVPAKIKDSRTLIPLRAVSEALECDVDWDGDTKTVYISKVIRNSGVYEIEKHEISEDVKDGDTVLMNIKYEYPEIKDSETPELTKDFIDILNAEYKENAEKYVDSVKEESLEDAKIVLENLGKDFKPLCFEVTYEVTFNRNNLLSITLTDYRDTAGPHPNIAKESRTFHVLMGKELALTDVFEIEQEYVDQTVYDSFLALMEKEKEDFGVEDSELLGDNLQNVKYYLVDDGLVMYYNPYEIAPYAYGMPEVKVDYEDGKYIKIDLSK